MKNKTAKIIASVAVAGSIIASGVAINNSIEKMELREKRADLIYKLQNEKISYDEYLQLIHEYNAEIKKSGGQMKLENINKDNSIIQRMNQKIVK